MTTEIITTDYQRHSITIELEVDPTVDFNAIEEALVEQMERMDGVLAVWIP